MSGLTLFMLGVLLLFNVRAFACGQERWAVKTLTDAQHNQVKHLAQAITIADLIDLPSPTQQQLNAQASSRFPVELKTYSLKATLLRWHRESDEDFHLVLSDSAGRTLIAEIRLLIVYPMHALLEH